MANPVYWMLSNWVILSLSWGYWGWKNRWLLVEQFMVGVDEALWEGSRWIWWGSDTILGTIISLSSLANHKTMCHPGPCTTVLVHQMVHVQLHHDHTILVCFYCLCFVTHIGLLVADMIIHDFYSFDDSSWPTIDPFFIVCQTHSLQQHSLSLSSLFHILTVGFLQSFGWSVHCTYPKSSSIYSIKGTCCIP